MISLRPYLTSPADSARKQVISLLLAKIALDAPVAEQADYRLFATEINQIKDGLDDDADEGALLYLAGAATQVIGSYNRRITAYIQKLESDAQEMVRMMTETVATISGDTARSAEKFRDIADRLETA